MSIYVIIFKLRLKIGLKLFSEYYLQKINI